MISPSEMIEAIKSWCKSKFITEIPIGSDTVVGAVKADGTTTTIDSDGTIHATGGGSGTGTTDYNGLENKPSIGGVTLSGNKTLSELGIQPEGSYLTEEADPTVPDWAKANEKPTYTADEVGLGDVLPLLENNARKNLAYTNPSNQTISGVTFTVNSNKSITLNGTATETGKYRIDGDFSGLESDNEYILSGCPAGGHDAAYGLYLYDENTGDTVANDYGDDFDLSEFTSGSDTSGYYLEIVFYSGQVFENFTFYPMIRSAEIEDDTYEPYYMTNKELTEGFSDLKPHAFVTPITNLLTTVAGSALDATMGKELDDKIAANTTAIEEVNSSLNSWQDVTPNFTWESVVTNSSSFVARYNAKLKLLHFSGFVTITSNASPGVTLGTFSKPYPIAAQAIPVRVNQSSSINCSIGTDRKILIGLGSDVSNANVTFGGFVLCS